MVSATAEAREAIIADAKSDWGALNEVEPKQGLRTHRLFVDLLPGPDGDVDHGTPIQITDR
ncbi:MAG: hypothetical protein WB711_18030 [Terriglobales bacterium]